LTFRLIAVKIHNRHPNRNPFNKKLCLNENILYKSLKKELLNVIENNIKIYNLDHSYNIPPFCRDLIRLI
jgi:hypothetical protein